MAEVTSIGETEFEEQVIKGQLPALVDFWAPWCAPCKMIAPVLDKLAVSYRDRLNIFKVNVDENPELARRFDILSIPSMLLFKEGALVDSFVGIMPGQALASRIEPHL